MADHLNKGAIDRFLLEDGYWMFFLFTRINAIFEKVAKSSKIKTWE